jgi:hypothetical protein
MDGIRTKAFEFSKRIVEVGRSIQRYVLFILQIIGWVLVLYFLTPLLASFQPVFFATKIPMTIGDFMLLITAAFVLAYTYQTQKLKEETIFQRRMSVAHDVRFRMTNYYRQRNEGDAVFGELTAVEALNNVCDFTFLTAVVGRNIGRCGIFQRLVPARTFLETSYLMETLEGRDAFLESLRLTNGEIRARVLVTNGETFIYTFRAVTDNWKRTLAGAPNLNDEFILVKKEVDGS